ncbi:MAG TPA: C39 family peptidase [Chthoniobacteraceae bacterium]
MTFGLVEFVGFWKNWHYLGAIEPSGGAYFPIRLELPVPSFRQNDPRWGKDLLGPTSDTVGGAGCALSSAAMVMSYYGIDTDPQRLNQFLNEHEGYTPQGWIYWEKAADLAPDHVHKAYEDLPSYCLIDCNLLHRNPVIVRLKLASGTTHFVVIAGKQGYDYLTRDPGVAAGRGLYPLRERGSKIYALRFYEKSK